MEGEEREKRKKERETETDTEPHRNTLHHTTHTPPFFLYFGYVLDGS